MPINAKISLSDENMLLPLASGQRLIPATASHLAVSPTTFFSVPEVGRKRGTKVKNPWFKFYPSDWRADPKLRCVSLAARGLWIEMLCIMHEAEPRGTLRISGVTVNEKQLASITGIGIRIVSAALSELLAAEIAIITPDNAIASKRMLRDTEKYNKDKENGCLGGNPKLTNGVNPPVKAQKLEARIQIPERKIENGSRRSSSIKGTRIPSDWKPDIEYAKSKGLILSVIQTETEKFKNYWSARAGTQGVKMDWEATWRNWVLTTAERIGVSPPAVAGLPFDVPTAATDWPTLIRVYKATGRWNPSHGPAPDECGYRGPK